jgi:hypothetical protein
MKSLKSVANLWVNKALYGAGAVVGSLAVIFEANCTLTLRPFSMSRVGRAFFVALGRTRLNWTYTVLGLLAVLVFSQFWIPTMSQESEINLMLLTPFGVFMSIHRRRVLSVSNHGFGRWSLHLNILKRAEGEHAKWAGVNTEFSDVVAMAIAAGARKLKCKSYLLVQDATADIFERKLTRAFRQHGVQVRVEVGKCEVMGAFRAGLHYPLKRFHDKLKDGRVSRPTAMSMMTRRIVVHIPENQPFVTGSPARA